MSAVFVAGAGTDIGKTYVAAALVRALRARGRPVRAYKPVVSGVPDPDHPEFAGSDTARLLDALGAPLGREAVDRCSPWRFAAPLAPDLAAAREGRRLELDEVAAWCRARREAAPPGCTVVVEGVGGVMSPLTDAATGLDWLKALDWPCLLVCGGYLGAISHALTALETLRAHRVTVLAAVVSAASDPPVPASVTARAIQRFAGPLRVAVVERGGAVDPDALGL